MKNKHRQHVNGLIALVAAAVLIIAGLIVWDRLERQQDEENEAKANAAHSVEMNADFYRDGVGYRLRRDVDTILLIGHDKNPEEGIANFRDGGQADFLLLLVVDNQNETVSMLQIDRDTMTRVHTVGDTGRDAGGKEMQICLAHAYGSNLVKNDMNTVRAVSEFLGGERGIRIDHSVSMYMDGISRINHLLGGVEVTIPEDMTNLDTDFVAGATITLTDEQAFDFCHARKSVGDGKNYSRMQRQKIFMESAAKTVQKRVRASGTFANTLVDSMMELTNMMDTSGREANKGWFINQLKKAATYNVRQPDILDGVRTTNPLTEYVECRVDPADVLDWVIGHLCY